MRSTAWFLLLGVATAGCAEGGSPPFPDPDEPGRPALLAGDYRQRAIEAFELGRRGDDNALSASARTLRDWREDGGIRRALLLGLEACGDVRALELIASAAEETDPIVREEALRILRLRRPPSLTSVEATHPAPGAERVGEEMGNAR